VSQTTSETSPARPMRADARRNYERLIAAAREALLDGDTDTSLDAIAKRAGVGIGTLYRHFPNRLALLEAVYRDEVDMLGARSERILEDADPWEGLVELLHGFNEYAANKRLLFQELIDATGRDSELFTHSRAVIESAFQRVLDKAQRAGVAKQDVVASDLMRLVGGCNMMPGASDEQRRRMVDIILDGLHA
jgi:AcrR family transcriptional regulator